MFLHKSTQNRNTQESILRLVKDVTSSSCVHLPVGSIITRRIKSFFPYNDRLSHSFLSKVVYKANCWDCDDFYIGKTKHRLHDKKTEHFKVLTKGHHTSAIADVFNRPQH